MINKLISICIVSVLGAAAPSVSFRPPVSTSVVPTTLARHNHLTKQQQKQTVSTTSLKISVEPSTIGGSVFWALNFYYGFDWLLAPLGTGLDNDFNPAYRTATFFGSLGAGKSLDEAAKATESITDEEGDRPEMGSRIGSGANVGYSMADFENENDNDWLSDREAGLRSSAPFPLQLAVAAFYGLLGVIAMTITGSLQTAAVLAIPALVYEIGRPSLPTREEAIFDAKLDRAVKAFADERICVYGQEILPVGVAPVRRDEATNERELVTVFKRERAAAELLLQNQDVSDFQIEMRFRELGTGRSEGGYIKGIRLLREPVSWQ